MNGGDVDPVPVGVQRRDQRLNIGVQLGASVEHHHDVRDQQPRPHHPHRRTTQQHTCHQHRHTSDHGDVLEEVAPRETLGGDTAGDQEQEVHRDTEPQTIWAIPPHWSVRRNFLRVSPRGSRQILLAHRAGGDTGDVVAAVVGGVLLQCRWCRRNHGVGRTSRPGTGTDGPSGSVGLGLGLPRMRARSRRHRSPSAACQ